jgi:hypothetical protein
MLTRNLTQALNEVRILRAAQAAWSIPQTGAADMAERATAA